MAQTKGRRNAIAAAASLMLAGALIAVAVRVHTTGGKADELLSPLQVGRYAVRAERQSGDYDQKAERQIAFATDNDDAATSERELAAKEEKRARQSAYLAADVKSRIDKILEAGRDQVHSAVCSLMLAGSILCSISAYHWSAFLPVVFSSLSPAGLAHFFATPHTSPSNPQLKGT